MLKMGNLTITPGGPLIGRIQILDPAFTPF